MYVPPAYEGGEPTAADFDLILKRVRDSGNETGARQLEALRGSNSFRILLVGSRGTSIAVAELEELSSVSLKRHVDVEVQQMQSGAVQSRDPVNVGTLAAERLTLAQGEGKFFQYYMKQGNNVWVVQYGGPAAEADAQRADFEKSAQTIKLSQ
jgi:hypothetical protein